MKEHKVTFYDVIILLDDEDFERVSKIKWQVTGSCNSALTAKQKGKNIRLANFIMRDYENTYDHKDRNFLNNQKDNLRICDNSQNGANKAKQKRNYTSKFKGVSYSKQSPNKPWKVQIKVDGYSIHLGYFYYELDAAEAYNKAANHYFGAFAVLNEVKPSN